MRKIFCIIATSLLSACGQAVQSKKTVAYEEIPSFDLLMLDSVTKFNTENISEGKPTLLMYISPDCEHCHELTKSMIKNIHLLERTQIYMFTPMTLAELKKFSSDFHLGDYKNIVVGQDYDYAFYRLYNATVFPSIAIYDRNKKLVKVYRGEITIDKIIESATKKS